METATIYLPLDAAAVSVGANEVAAALQIEAANRKIDIDLIRTGSRGMFWLEPLVEVETTKGRIAYGPVSQGDVPELFEAGFLKGGDHPLLHGLTEQIPYLAKQERLTFKRCGVIDPLSLSDYEAHGGLRGLRNALTMTPGKVVEIVTQSGLRGARRGGVSHRD